ncbi:Peptidoglycan/LPS O-acetylase OafA/YrhL, contains acyltransferase and SGNH-hydrolase domains [Nonomuraea pusilla]|uniref:Peptidoglycan/LPS O-acetylase OafA/YrhL, contains acyltransferase and SGNH-hydrolase domains n=1 Tax=Nonomuraea pusilla TaxID=46177 RepID=A0A1H7R8A4_9ACTN|nr:Peptidoglycan/LPS O-acetylase OafA/YrhL, contains acyltransferase and SGNH-hydrolase domains [Nonomuraea pusilla]
MDSSADELSDPRPGPPAIQATGREETTGCEEAAAREDASRREEAAGREGAEGRQGVGGGRLGGLDGVRGLAALFVVLHHCRLLAYPGFPADTGPWWASWLLYGHFAVVVFIALSGFSLAVSPARAGWRLGGVRRFARRRAWRILPPYWAALLFSLVVAWTLAPQPGQPVPTGKTVVVYGLLLQDVFGSPSPNGALWSIAVEAQLYVLFPLLLLAVRRVGATVTVGAVTVVVVAVGLLAPSVPAVGALMRLTPQFAVLFAVGVVAAAAARETSRPARQPSGRAREPWRRARQPSGPARETSRPAWGRRGAALPWLALAAAAPVAVLIAVRSPAWTIGQLFWVDLALAPAAGLLLASVARGRPAPLVRLLDTRPVRSLGSFSYSLYLVHAPIVVALDRYVAAPLAEPGTGRFLLLLALAVPVSLVFARGFAAVFELPFQRHRSGAALRAAARNRLTRQPGRPA